MYSPKVFLKLRSEIVFQLALLVPISLSIQRIKQTFFEEIQKGNPIKQMLWQHLILSNSSYGSWIRNTWEYCFITRFFALTIIHIHIELYNNLIILVILFNSVQFYSNLCCPNLFYFVLFIFGSFSKCFSLSWWTKAKKYWRILRKINFITFEPNVDP